ncbi:hypothetical protein Q8H44_16625, partial [Acinetobacter lwoffii]|nr:hypothetical protein [Acinetobacter lwoffii]
IWSKNEFNCWNGELDALELTFARDLLYMSALTAIKYNPHIEALYQRLLSQGKNKMCALGAAMRKLIHLCYGVLKHQTAYQRDYLLVE